MRNAAFMAVIYLVDGPLHGTIHEVHDGFGIPNRLGLADEQRTLQHWYTVHQTDGNQATAHFDKSIPIGQASEWFDRVQREHPWLCRWEAFKLSCTEFLARWLNIHVDW